MIRDPSDGSTKTVADHQSAISEPQKEMVSGLPINKAKPDFLARLQRSREQLAEYRASGKFENGNPGQRK